MATVRKFERGMIETYLKKKKWNYLQDRDGDFRVEFTHDTDLGCELTAWFICGGAKEEIYAVWLTSDLRIAKSQWARAVLACNTWNDQKRWPKASLHIPNDDTEIVASIRLEGQLDLETGVHQEFLEGFSESILWGGTLFWQWLHQEQGFS